MFQALLAPATTGFSHYVPIVISHTQVSGTQATYVLTVDHTDAHLKTVANGGYVTNANCFDCGFYSDTCITKLSWDQLQVYDGSVSGRIVASVQVGTINSSSDVTIYLCVGNSSLTTFQGGATGSAWPSIYRDVKHFSKNGALDLTDYSTNGNTGTASGNFASSTSCPSGQCASNSTGNSGDASASGGFANGTVEMWVNFASVASCCQTAFDTQTNGWQIYMSSGHLQCASDGNGTLVASTTVFVANTWYHIVCTAPLSGAGTAFLYVNGVQDNSGTQGSNVLNLWTGLYYMSSSVAAQNVSGKIAEARLINTFMGTADRPLTDYNNQNAPDTFAPWGIWH